MGMTVEEAIKNRREVYQAAIDRGCCDRCRVRGELGLALFEIFVRKLEEIADKNKIERSDVLYAFGGVVGDLVSCLSPTRSIDDQMVFTMAMQCEWAKIVGGPQEGRVN